MMIGRRISSLQRHHYYHKQNVTSLLPLSILSSSKNNNIQHHDNNNTSNVHISDFLPVSLRTKSWKDQYNTNHLLSLTFFPIKQSCQRRYYHVESRRNSSSNSNSSNSSSNSNSNNNTRSRRYYDDLNGIPSAYRSHYNNNKDKSNKDKSSKTIRRNHYKHDSNRNNNNNTSFSRRRRRGVNTNNNHNKQSSSKTKKIEWKEAEVIKKKIHSLLEMDVDLREKIQSYEATLGTHAFYPSTFMDTATTTTTNDINNNEDEDDDNPTSSITENIERNRLSYYKSTFQEEKKKEWLRKISFQPLHDNESSRLINTEEEYIQICIHIKQLIARWSRVNPKSRQFVSRCLSSAKQESSLTAVNFSSIPAKNALSYCIFLESLRKQRADLIEVALESLKKRVNEGNIGRGVFGWFQSISMSKSSTDDDVLSKLEDLTAHISRTYTTNANDYNLIIKSFANRQRLSQDSSLLHNSEHIQKSLKHIESIVALMERCATEGNPNSIPDSDIYYLLISQYCLHPTVKSSLRCLDILNSMIENKKQGYNQHNWPNRRIFNSVLMVLRETARCAKTKNEKLEVISHVENILNQLESQDDVEYDESGNIVEVGDTFHIALDVIGEVGRFDCTLPDYCKEIDKLMIRMIGEEAYTNLCAENDVELPKTVRCKMLGDIVQYFSHSNDRTYLERAKIILNKMIKSQNQSLNYVDSKTYNSLVVGLIHLATKDKEKRNHLVRQDAIYATTLLDHMMQDKSSSMPYPVTYFRLLRLWSNCHSMDAGEKGEGILSKLNIHKSATVNNSGFDSIFFRVYLAALECWRASSKAQCPGVPRRVDLLLNRMNAQYEIENIMYETSVNSKEKNMKELTSVYETAIRCCAGTVVQTDKEDALKVAFRIFNKMQDESIPCNAQIYLMLLRCCSFAKSPSEQDSFSRQVFDIVCEENCVNEKILVCLKYVNFELFQSYNEDMKNTEASDKNTSTQIITM